MTREEAIRILKSNLRVTYTDEVREAHKVAIEALGQPQIVRCKDCKHKPTKQPIGKDYDLDFPDSECPCQNPDDGWYSYCPEEDWFCANGEPKGGDGE